MTTPLHGTGPDPAGPDPADLDLTGPPPLTPRRTPTELVVLDDRFAGVRGDRRVETWFDGGRWLEGPVHAPAWRSLLFSDIPNDWVLRLDETTGRVTVWKHPVGFHNGHTLDRRGRVVACEHGTRSLTRTETDGSITTLADRWQGDRLNSPNDVVESADGSLWFTDPAYGIDDDYEGHRSEPEVDGCHLYRLTPDGRLDAVVRDFDRPNGLAFSADERQLYVTDTARNHIRRFDVTDSGLSGGEVWADCTVGAFDGIRVDDSDRIWGAAGDGLHCLAPDGTLIGKLLLPKVASNLTFGGPRGSTLYVTATTALHAIVLNVAGARYPR